MYERAFALEIKRLEMLYCRVRILYDMGMYDQAWGQVPMRSRKIPEMLRHGYWKAISPLKKG